MEGALVVGRSPSEAAMGGSTIPNPQPQIRKIPPREVEPLDLAEMSRGAVLKRAVPVVAGLAALAAVVWLVRRG